MYFKVRNSYNYLINTNKKKTERKLINDEIRLVFELKFKLKNID